ncbi:MAG: N-acetylmuramoyl-L-alanine amidase [Verrucomicrobia bacterium]|nr:N-acetylmuramoyl-L-alanine amidase [Verrucomicrobiota bacterium]MCG2681498.1 N-acetylmuramoyl-L-alanine amidase [Kiritimatiellia bacterium]MBU4248262.1 N-acetylmuramoyl-L-alanine amidase [Verrucomicrobiota bacterium]MBU4289878.1 N-acetylmuramoyl-L-alanine amidase [Verrucomicrobiota bacterium]MBU4428177.1 N-acetylmuramoyl-L-alanine amidase [Verrucomicrobiota bacterium]
MNTDEYYFSRRRCGFLTAWLPIVLSGILMAGVPVVSGGADNHDGVSLQALSRSYGFRSWSVQGNTATLLTRFNSLELETGSRRAAFNGITVWLNSPIEKSWGRWLIRQVDVDKTVIPLLNPLGKLVPEGFGLVVLDSGHGGNDCGAVMPRQGMAEKQLTLELATNVRDILMRYRVLVRLTRADDQAVPLDDRYHLAAVWKADVFVSIHMNAAASSKPSGIETYILTPAGFPSTADNSGGSADRNVCPGNRHDAANMVLGYTLHKSLLKYTHGEDRGVRRSRFVVIRNASCPAALVECGFLSSRADQQKILVPSYRNDIARGIAEGILTYLNTVKRAHQIVP